MVTKKLSLYDERDEERKTSATEGVGIIIIERPQPKGHPLLTNLRLAQEKKNKVE